MRVHQILSCKPAFDFGTACEREGTFTRASGRWLLVLSVSSWSLHCTACNERDQTGLDITALPVVAAWC